VNDGDDPEITGSPEQIPKNRPMAKMAANMGSASELREAK